MRYGYIINLIYHIPVLRYVPGIRSMMGSFFRFIPSKGVLIAQIFSGCTIIGCLSVYMARIRGTFFVTGELLLRSHRHFIQLFRKERSHGFSADRTPLGNLDDYFGKDFR